ncbi:DinB family protein [Clostridium sp. CF012]|uniref:DinB family protein n=1 Tax=Clostridium sp. CF012 TaxID=2843319 RepID=UPI001C0B9544|nr:DinB family protein [Clostridium sp. CF012]MBU3144943.1 DinB family protein [Clostridium sp. CF012]
MNSDILFKIAKIQFELSFLMLEKMIEMCPDDLWNEKKGGFVFWQQLLHAFSGINYWLRMNNDKFIEPFADKKVFPELEHEPESILTKDDLTEYKNIVKSISETFFFEKDDEWLGNNSIIYDKIKNLDVVFMQIRHIQYHVGHCNSILRENNREAVEWLDYYGE